MDCPRNANPAGNAAGGRKILRIQAVKSQVCGYSGSLSPPGNRSNNAFRHLTAVPALYIGSAASRVGQLPTHYTEHPVRGVSVVQRNSQKSLGNCGLA